MTTSSCASGDSVVLDCRERFVHLDPGAAVTSRLSSWLASLLACLLSLSLPARATAAGCEGEPRKAWTVLVFMMADAHLHPFALADLREMQAVGSTADMNVLVHLDTPARAQRFYVRDGARDVCQAAPGTPDLPGSLASFLAWGEDRFPATQRMVVIWGHSRGVAVRLTQSAGDIKAAEPPDELRTIDVASLAAVLRRVASSPRRRVPDLLAFDSCFMSSLEAAYQLRHAARYMVASESTVDRSGWDYAVVLRLIAQRKGAVTPAAFGAHIVRHGDDLATATDLALLDLRQAAGLLVAMQSLVRALNDAIRRSDDERKALRILLGRVAHTKARQFLDLDDLCLAVQDEFGPRVARDAAQTRARLRALVIDQRARAAPGARLTGVSLYYPQVFAPMQSTVERRAGALMDATIDRRGYGALEFVRASGWLTLVEALADERAGR